MREMTKPNKRFFTNHAKSSAMLISLVFHAVLIVVALSFVAVTVIQKEDHKFESKQVIRPKMALKKLQVPVKIKKQKRKPRLRQRIVVKHRVDRNMPDIKMPEISGIKSGLGSNAETGLGGAGSIGFNIPEIELFGIKSKGEKVFLILDSSPEMMYDEMGGIPAYTIIKNELIRIIEGLGATTIFNVCVFGGGQTYYLFPTLAPATAANAAKAKEWLDPLNAVTIGMSDKGYGTKTLGPGGTKIDDDLRVGSFLKSTRKLGWWYGPAMVSMSQQADTVFLLTNRWPSMGYKTTETGGSGLTNWKESPDGIKWEKCYQKGLKMLDAENKKRAERGMPPKVLRRNAHSINKEYFPNIKRPPSAKVVEYTPKDFHEAFLELRSKTTSIPSKSGLPRKSPPDKYSFNVIQFVKQGEEVSERTKVRYRELTKRGGGKYRTIAGLDAIESYVKTVGE